MSEARLSIDAAIAFAGQANPAISQSRFIIPR